MSMKKADTSGRMMKALRAGAVKLRHRRHIGDRGRRRAEARCR